MDGLPPLSTVAEIPPVKISTLVAVIAIGCVALLMFGIQPLALGALQSAGRISVMQMGTAATVELLTLGGVSAFMAGRFRPRSLRIWTLVGCVFLVAANAFGLAANGSIFIVTRGIAGIGGGIIVWVATVLIIRRMDAARVNAMFYAAQALSQGAAAALIPLTLNAPFGANASLVVLGGSALLVLPLILLLPQEISAVHSENSSRAAFQSSSVLGLCAAFFVMAGIVGVWVYLEPIATASGMSESVISSSIAASLGAQVVGALAIAAVIRLVPPFLGTVLVALAYLLLTAVFGWSHNVAGFVIAALAFGVLWSIGMSLLLPMMLRLDPTRRAAMFLPAVIMFGSGSGPFIAGTFASDTDITPALIACAAMFTACAGLTALAAFTSRKMIPH